MTGLIEGLKGKLLHRIDNFIFRLEKETLCII